MFVDIYWRFNMKHIPGTHLLTVAIRHFHFMYGFMYDFMYGFMYKFMYGFMYNFMYKFMYCFMYKFMYKSLGCGPGQGLSGSCWALVPGLAGPCLLYTSPSPRDVEESRMPSSA